MSEEAKSEKKSIKVTKMNLSQVNAAIETTQKNMGALYSRYGFALVAMKKALTGK